MVVFELEVVSRLPSMSEDVGLEIDLDSTCTRAR